MSSPSPTDSREIIELQHEALRVLVEALPVTRDPGELAAKLAELHTQLEAHYAVEEGQDGFYEIIVKHAPRHHTKVQRLFDEHRDLLRRVDAIAAKSRALAEGPAAEIYRDLTELVKMLGAHEKRESALLGDAMYHETGFGG